MTRSSIQPVRRPSLLLCLTLVALAMAAVSPAPAGLAQGGCAAPASAEPAAAPAAFSPSGTIGLGYVGSLGGDTYAVASVRATSPVIFSSGAGLMSFFPLFSNPLRLTMPDLIRDIAVGGATIYVAAGGGGLQIVGGGGSQRLGSLHLPGVTAAIDLDGPLAYLVSAGPGGGLHVADVANPARPRLLGSAPTFGAATAIDVAGGRAYVAEGVGGGVEIFDVSDPRSPTLLGGLVTPGAARGIAVDGGRAYVAGEQCGLQVLDVSDPARPRLLGAVGTADDALAIQIAEGRAYVAAGSAGLLAFDLGGPLPRQVGARRFEPGEAIRDVFIDEGLAHLAAGPAGTIAVDVRSPTLPLAGGAPTMGGVRAARPFDGDVYLALGNYGVGAVEATLPEVSVTSSVRQESSTSALNLAVGPMVGGEPTIYASRGAAGIGIIRREPGGLLRRAGDVALPGTVGALLVDGDRAYAAAGTAGVHLLSLENPLSPALQRSIDTPGAALDLAISGGLLYVADRDGLRVIDPAAGQAVGGYSAPAGSFVQGVAVQGGRAYLADRRGLIALDVSDPRAPRPLPGASGFSAYALAARPGQLFVAAGKDGVLAFDVGGPGGPRLAAVYDTPGTALGLTIDGDTLLVSDNEGGILRLRVVSFTHRLRLPLVWRGEG